MAKTVEKRMEEIRKVSNGKYSEDELRSLAEWDLETDRMSDKEIREEMTEEQRKVQKEMLKADRKKEVKTEKTVRKVKENPTKAQIISDLAEFLDGSVENLQILNKERQISFKIGDETYEITLIQKRKPK